MGMTDYPYTITERTSVTRTLNVFIPYPDEDEGGGWSYNATSDHDNVSIEFMGYFPRKHLPTLIELLETAAREDKNRNEEYGSPSFNYDTYEKEEEEQFRADADERKLPVIGIAPEDFWICNGASIRKDLRDIATITLMRASNRYVALNIGYPNLSFNTHELEAVTALLKNFLPEED
jgi:hypothetical protein